MKKILSFLSILSIIASSSTLTIACSNPIPSISDNEPEWEEKKTYYELFGERFTSKEAAISYFTNEQSGVKIDEKIFHKNKLLLGEEEFYDIEKMYEYIDQKFPITELQTSKNPDNFIMDGMNQLTPEVISNDSDEIKVYRDKDGNAISDIYNDENAYKIAENSFLDDIEELYVVDEKEFKTIEDIKMYYTEKFVNQEKLKSEDLYNLGNFVYSEEGLRGKIKNSIKAKYSYNGKEILEEQINDLSTINPTDEDKQKIQKINSSPGSYLIETTGNEDGQYMGDKVIQSDVDLREIILNKDKWILSESTSASVKDAAYDLINSILIGLVGQFVNLMSFDGADLEFAIDNMIVETPTLNNIFNFYNEKDSYDTIENLINKYDLKAEINTIIQNVSKIQTLSFGEKSGIALYQLQEAFRYSNISSNSSDSSKLNEIMFRMLKNMDKENSDWEEFVDVLGKENSNLGFQYLVEPSQFFKNINSLNNYSIIIKSIDKLREIARKDAMTNTKNIINLSLDFIKKLDKTGIASIKIAKVSKLFDVLVKANTYFEVISIILDVIPFSTTETYMLIIPNSSQVLKFQITSNWFKKNKFNPSEIFNVTELKKPIENSMWLYNNRYYSTYDDALNSLKKDIMYETLNSNNVLYFSTYKEDVFLESKEQLIDQLVEFFKNTSTIKNKYTDYFGNLFNNEREAYESLIKNINDKNFEKIYKYDYSTSAKENVIYSKYKKDLTNQIKKDLLIESKVVDISELNSGNTNFDLLEDLSKFKYKIYSFKFNGMNYYFKDKINATYFIMKKLDFKNIFEENSTKTYTLNNIEFENIYMYIDYLYKNMKEIIVTGREEVI